VAIEWAGLAPDLLLRLERGSAVPLRVQLESGIRAAIRHGRLADGERLPSSRELARQLGVSRGLVQECYGQLIAEGYLISREGSATRVAPGAAGTSPADGPDSDAVLASPSDRTLSSPPSSPASPHLTAAPGPLWIADFRIGVPDLASFPRADWSWAMRETCRTVPTTDLDYGDPRGAAAFRRILAGYLRRVRAADADPDRIVATTGFAQAIVLVLRALARTGIGTVAFEDPGYGLADAEDVVRAVGAPGFRVVHVPVDDQGIDIDALAATGAGAVVVTPAHQSPTGVVLTPQRRHALVDWARRAGASIIEDDYDSEFRYDREPVGVLQGLAPERVFTIGTASKTLAPALRFGWVLTPPAFAEAVAAEKLISDRGSSALDQLAFATLLESGRYDRHLRRMRTVYAGRRAALVDALARHAPNVRLTGLAAGFHAVAHLSPSHDELAVVAAARERSVRLYAMAEHRSTVHTAHAAVSADSVEPRLVLGIGLVTERAIEAGIAAVADLLRAAAP
jgi:GntR family transcriptional regulator/MocR family aminotransferase